MKQFIKQAGKGDETFSMFFLVGTIGTLLAGALGLGIIGGVGAWVVAVIAVAIMEARGKL